ncbi:MAG: hypothetical protein H6747_09965 [Deltaproteobacteria bacterium]|nr:hypothetical protein [Deltaproteobacteria bacterium]
MSKNTVIQILSIEPSVIRVQEPFKAHWSVEVDDQADLGNVELTFQTDDARLLLFEHQGEESPVLKPLALGPGAKIKKTTLLEVRLRQGLVGEESRDGTAAPLSVHARLNGDGQRLLAISSGYGVQVADLAERPSTKIFI